MDDLISRQALLDEMKKMYAAAEKWCVEATTEDVGARAESCMATLVEMKLRTEKLPSAQPEIIRCKDCKNSEPWYGDKSLCFLWAEIGIGVSNDGFCSYARKMEVEYETD